MYACIPSAVLFPSSPGDGPPVIESILSNVIEITAWLPTKPLWNCSAKDILFRPFFSSLFFSHIFANPKGFVTHYHQSNQKHNMLTVKAKVMIATYTCATFRTFFP